MSSNWKALTEDEEEVNGFFWDQEEFFAYCSAHPVCDTGKSTFWRPDSCSKTCYLLATVMNTRERFDSALVCNASGLELESDHPDLWSQRGYINLKLQRFEEALRCYEQATQVRSWASARQLARAHRGIGVALVDLQRLEQAEVALKRSLEFEPESEAALSEIEYINNLRREREEARKNLPWFVDAYLHPSTDPLTVRLLKITDGLPQLNGPEVVGTENYAAIAKAFMERGWVGFEEAFGSRFPRTHPDHEQIKRDLLCEAIFRPEVHRRMTLMLTGKMDLEDVHREQQQARKQRVD